MKLMPLPARLAALLTGLIVAASCDTRLPTQSSATDDVERPTVKFVASGGVNNAVSAGTPLSVTVTASDNKGISTIQTTVRSGSQIIGIDTATLKPTATSTSRVVPVSLAGLKRGDKVVVRSTVTDAALNTRVDSLVLTIASPTQTFKTPAAGSSLNVGDSLLVTDSLHDDAGLVHLTLSAFTPRGNPALGTADTIQRYNTVVVPAVGSFRPGLTDTVITRYIIARTPVDTLTDSLYVQGIAVDALGGADTTRRAVKIVRGPSITILSPVAGDSATAGAGLTVTLRATDATGIALLGFHIQTSSAFPTQINTDFQQTYSGLPRDVTFSTTVQIPANAPLLGIITITPISRNSGGQVGASASTTIAVRAGQPPAPRVFQTIARRVETQDSISITALGNGVTSVGYILFDSTGNNVVLRDSIRTTAPFPSTSVVTLSVNLPTTAQGKTYIVVSFSYDQCGRIRYTIPNGTTSFQTVLANARRDTTLVVYGRTYALPVDRNGVVADLTVDALRGNIFLSNINYGRLEVLAKGATTFDANGIVVGSQPWGMTMSRTAPGKDTLYVANSGGTNLSRVFIGGAPSAMREDLANRLLTRVSFLFKVSEVRDVSTNKIRISVTGPILFSDRPQYVEQSAQGLLYLSTKPTAAAPKGTVRYMDPKAPAPDERFLLAFATQGTDPNSFLVANLDAVSVIPAPANSTANDVLTMCDHPTGSTAAATCASSANGIVATVAALRTAVPTTDLEIAANADENSLGLTDTTYAASSGDGTWLSFGEGNKAPFARTFLLKDDGTVPGSYTYASPAINVTDLINNASDKVQGVALDLTGKTLGVHGSETYFAAVDQPFTQRLQGKKTTFGSGAGIAFHPLANGVTTPQQNRLAFVASNNGSIEAVDIAYYDFSRGSLATKFNLYGPLRVSLPFPGDPASVVLKLFGVSSKGLVVIDVTAADLKAGP